MSEPHTRVAVLVTFLRLERAPMDRAPALPPDAELVQVADTSIAFYRYLYNTVGADYVWWLRRSMSDRELGRILTDDEVTIHVLYQGGEPAGFFELDRNSWPDVNLSYFGLMPRAVGAGIGYAFLRAALDRAFGEGAAAVTVNTCSADHKRALPTYMRAGFMPVRQVREVWSVPNRLGLRIPAHLKT
jgi:GNAT superfamily N-acetyltransferase